MDLRSQPRMALLGLSRLGDMSARPITEALVQEVSEDLRSRYALDDEDVRELGTRLASQDQGARSAANLAFAKEFTGEHRETFDRLGR